jgi:hypothetical protein
MGLINGREKMVNGILIITALGPTQPPIHWVPGAVSLGVKRSGREADHSPPSSAKVKNAWSYTSIPQYVFMASCLVKLIKMTRFPHTSGTH